MFSKKIIVGAFVAALSAGASAAVERFDFQYTLAGGAVLEGSLMGELQADNNTIVVDSFEDFVRVKGVDGPGLTFVESVKQYGAGVPGDPTVSMDGSVMDIIACVDATCINAFLFESSGALFGVPYFLSGSLFGLAAEVYNPDNWVITRSAVPEPMSLALLGLALTGLALRRRA